ncbi:MAG: glycine oxidase ThiO [Alphaproteobacteria bacterium]|nr:glycine oxidase ThiO [Alphaproteobacteria bacterium]HCP47422.1 glycine oxidase ThiO [Deltaproteobacteria bacterium]
MTGPATHQQVDLLVIGGGIHGCAIAHEVASSTGRQVVVLEKSVPGAEASGAAAGILGPHLECDEPGPFLDLCRHSLALYPEWVQRLEADSGHDLEFSPCGGVLVALNSAERDRLQTQAILMADSGLPGTWLNADSLRRAEPEIGPNLGGLSLPEEAQVDPKKVMGALAVAARKAGVSFEQDTVTHISGGPTVQVRAQRRTYHAKQLVVAAGAWAATLPGIGLSETAVVPARGQIVLLGAAVPPTRTILFSHRGYVVPRADGRVLCGSTLEFEGFQKAVTANGVSKILDLATELLPQLATAELLDAWSGFRPYTEDHMPLLGHSGREGIWLATGHYRNGILLAPATAKIMAALLSGESPSTPVDAFDPRRGSRPTEASAAQESAAR